MGYPVLLTLFSSSCGKITLFKFICRPLLKRAIPFCTIFFEVIRQQDREPIKIML